MRRVFADDWRDTLREQYKYVIQQGDKRTEETLTAVLHEVGFTEDELATLRLQATMRAEDMPDDYVPDEVKQSYTGVDVPVEEPVSEVVQAVDVEPDEDSEVVEDATYDELIGVAEVPPNEEAHVDEEIEDVVPEDDDDEPQQMSLF